MPPFDFLRRARPIYSCCPLVELGRERGPLRILMNSVRLRESSQQESTTSTRVLTCDSARFDSTEMRRDAPSVARIGSSVPNVECGGMATDFEPRIRPWSNLPTDSSCTLTPVDSSPFIIACWIGAAPRYLGRSEGWTLRVLSGANLESSRFGMR